ncbi:MAG: hypothetical protein CM15mP116_10000 [Synechococcus sp.]|nr:MAG: hypothetical protein CM15mP116_10000 [Synechococcus sp.]
MNHGGIEALLIQDLMHNLMMQSSATSRAGRRMRRTPWLLVNQLVAIQPGISTTGQPRGFNLIVDTV